MLHQFLSAETIQVSEERALFIFLGTLFLGHDSTVLDSQLYVNMTAGHRKTSNPETWVHQQL
jgi:hypothetical protein